MTIESKPIRLSPVGKFITVAILVALAILLVRALGPVMSPFVAAAITAYVFNPVIRWLHVRTRVSRGVWILALYALMGMLVYALVRFVGPLIVAQYRELTILFPVFIRAGSRE